MSGETSQGHVYIDKRLLTAGAALVAVGGLLGFAGMTIGGAAVLAAVRHWVKQMEVSPRERAALRWHQAKEASLAGAHAWRDAAPTGRI
jgi:uncharacterized protein (DUF1786 family)